MSENPYESPEQREVAPEAEKPSSRLFTLLVTLAIAGLLVLGLLVLFILPLVRL